MSVGSVFGGHFGSVENEGGGGGGGVTQIVPGENITVNPTSGVGAVTINAGGVASWTTGKTRIYTLDAARADDSGAGFADPASSSAADYRTASVAAGAIAKKTVAGLAAIFPKAGEGRQVEIQIAAGAYNGDDLSALLNGISGYASCVVRGTGTVATAGVTKFDGTAADTSTVGGVTGTGLFAAGYHIHISAANGQTFPVIQTGGGAAGFAQPSGLPIGIRTRFDVATTTAAIRNQARQVCRLTSSEQITHQTTFAATPVAADTLYLEQPGVRLTGNLDLVAGGTDGIILVGLAWAGSLNVRTAAGRHRFVFCTFDDAGTETLTSTDGVVVSQSYTHSIYGVVTPGGGLLLQGNATVTGPRLALEGLVTQLQTTICSADGKSFWGAGCLARNVVINSSWLSDGDDFDPGLPFVDAIQPNIGIPQSAPAYDGQPTTFGNGGITNAALTLNASKLRIGPVRFNNFAAAAIACTGKCGVNFVGVANATSDGSGLYGLDLTAASETEVRVSSNVPSTVTGSFADIRWAGPVAGPWGNIQAQEGHDVAGNHIYYQLGPAPDYAHSTTRSVFFTTFTTSAGVVPRFALVMGPGGGPGVVAATNTTLNVVAGSGLVGTTQMAGTGISQQITIRPPGGCTMVAFTSVLSSADVGKVAYVSGTAGLATVTVPGSGPVIPIGIVVATTAAAEAVIAWFPAGMFLTVNNPIFTGEIKSSSDGTPTDPSFYWDGPGGKYGFYRVSSNAIGIVRAGTEIFRIDFGTMSIPSTATVAGAAAFTINGDTAYGRTAGGFAEIDNAIGCKVSAGLSSWGHSVPPSQPVAGAATAGVVYTATEQTMLQKVYDALRGDGTIS